MIRKTNDLSSALNRLNKNQSPIPVHIAEKLGTTGITNMKDGVVFKSQSQNQSHNHNHNQGIK